MVPQTFRHIKDLLKQARKRKKRKMSQQERDERNVARNLKARRVAAVGQRKSKRQKEIRLEEEKIQRQFQDAKAAKTARKERRKVRECFLEECMRACVETGLSAFTDPDQKVSPLFLSLISNLSVHD